MLRGDLVSVWQKHLPQKGMILYLTSLNEVKLYQALESLMGRFPNQVIKAKPFDLGTKQGAMDFGNWVLELGVEPDILINNAGTFQPGRVIDEPDGQLENMLQVNLLSAYHLTRILLPSMMKRKSGHIFNISSIAALQAYPNGGSYSISKFALTGFSKNLREELKPYSIKVTCIYPGAVYTDSWAGSGVKPGPHHETFRYRGYHCSNLQTFSPGCGGRTCDPSAGRGSYDNC